jgi:putative hemolysin
VPVKKLLVEIQSIESDFTLFKLKNFTVYCAPSSKIPDLLTEIGRLREITFREVGEGTNRSIDIDEYDLYYHQLFIWDHNEKRLAGAYRIGPGREILTQYGKQGFYINTLFSIEDEMTPVLNECLELGRSFIVSDYQRKTLPLFMLWKGILYFLLKNPGYRYLIGPASISNNYSPVSKELIVKFIMKNHFDENLAEWMLPRHEFKFSKNDNLIKTLLQSTENDIDLLDKTVSDLEEQNQGLPVLIKKYIQLNAKIIGFNIDPDFNYSLDGLIFLDAFNIPEQVLESLSKDLNDQALLERFITKKE